MHERTAEKNWPTNYKLVLLRFTQGNDKLKFIGQKAPGEELACPMNFSLSLSCP
jgi:hypothetical protein